MPEVFEISQKNLDFVVIVSDGVTHTLDNGRIINTIWDTIKLNNCKNSLKKCIDNVLKLAIIEGSQDDSSMIMVAFKKF